MYVGKIKHTNTPNTFKPKKDICVCYYRNHIYMHVYISKYSGNTQTYTARSLNIFEIYIRPFVKDCASSTPSSCVMLVYILNRYVYSAATAGTLWDFFLRVFGEVAASNIERCATLFIQERRRVKY